MTVDELIFNINNANLQDLLSITKVLSVEDVKKYKAEGYSTCPLSVFKDTFPDVKEKDLSFICYQKENAIPELLYYNPDELQFFSLRVYYTSEDFSFLAMNEEKLSFLISALKNKINEKKKSNDYFLLYKSVPSAYIMEYFCKTVKQIPSEFVYELFMNYYGHVDFGSSRIALDEIQYIIDNKSSEQKEKTIEELKRISDKESLHVYRGLGDKSFWDGYSFTLSEDVARFFAFRHSGNAESVYIMEGDINKNDVIEYIEDRDEQEIICLPDKIINQKMKRFYGIQYVDSIDKVISEFRKQKNIFEVYCYKNSIDLEEGKHNSQHMLRVLCLSIILAKHYRLKKSYCYSLYNAAMLHDIGREGDGVEPEHGLYSYEMVAINSKSLAQDLLMKNLIIYHCRPDEEAEEIFKTEQEILAYKILKDADALDRQRFGIRHLSSRYLRLEYSYDLMFAAFQLTNMKM